MLQREVHGKPLIYLDNAATSQKPEAVIQAVDDYYRRYNANIHRSPHLLGQEATELYDDARGNVARFIGAEPGEIAFVPNTSTGINLIADLRAQESTQHLTIIAHTVQSSKELVDKMMEFGVIGYLLKPYSEKEIYPKLKKVLARVQPQSEAAAYLEGTRLTGQAGFTTTSPGRRRVKSSPVSKRERARAQSTHRFSRIRPRRNPRTGRSR